jgi:broad specificity phosphatase PhoE
MTKYVELRRHTASDGDTLTPGGVRTAVELGGRLSGGYDLLLSSGAQRATQTLACLLAGSGRREECGVTVDPGLRSDLEERWYAAAAACGGGDLAAFRRVDAELVDLEARRLGAVLRRVVDALPDGGRALIVGHSPMHEAAVYGLTGEIVAPISKGAGVLIVEEGGGYRVEALR